jgi:hypothetical protein
LPLVSGLPGPATRGEQN